MLARATKRIQADYTGLEGGSQKKRRTAKRNNNRQKIATLTEDHEPASGTDCRCITSDQIAIQNTAVGDGSVRTGIANATVPTVAVDSSCAPELVTSLQSPVWDESTLVQTHGVSNADASIPFQLTSAVDCVDARFAISSVREFFGSAVAFNAMETILQHCVKVNFTFAKYRSGEAMVTTNIEDIQRYASSMVDFEYSKAVYAVKKSRALATSQDLQVRYNESFYWDIIMKGVKCINPLTLKNRGGPADEFTQAEKDATKVFMDQAGMGTSRENQRQRRRMWKCLSDMRRAGVDNILLYRTREFDALCEQNPKHDNISLVERVLSWEKVYGPHITDLASRAMKEARRGPTGELWLKNKYVIERLDHMSKNAWNGAKDVWHSAEEKAAFHSTSDLTTVSSDRLGGMFNQETGAGMDRNKSIYVTLMPREQDFLSVCSIITIKEGDFLGIFTGYFRYSEDFDDVYGIRGPTEKLWLDYSEVTGVLNQIRVAAPGENANVALQWELIGNGSDSPCKWRVAARALSKIRPFESFVRVAHHEAQYLLHQTPACARRGFTKSVNVCQETLPLE